MSKINYQNKEEYTEKDKIMTVNFIFKMKKIAAVSCVETNIFAEIEEKLYKQYPEFRETNNNYFVNGEPILRFKTLRQNNISNGSFVTIEIP